MAADKIIRNTKLDTFLSKLATKLASIFWRKAETTQITIDSTPTASSTNLVTSGGVKSYVDGAIPSVPVTDVTVGGTSVVSSGTAVIPAIPTVPVTDVTVGGTSVVSNGTAVIPAIPTDVVQTTSQVLTDTQKMQARKNLDLYYEEPGVVQMEFDADGEFKRYPGEPSSSTYGWYKSSDDIVQKADVTGQTISSNSTEITITSEMLVDGLNGYVIYADGPNMSGPMALVALQDGAALDGASNLSAGVWLLEGVDWLEYEGNVVTKIPSKYLPKIDGQIQSDWEQSDTTAKDYIKNKPTVLDNYELTNYNVVPSKWNVEINAGVATPSFTLPTPTRAVAEEIRYIFSPYATSATFTAPSGYILADADGFAGLLAGNTLSYGDLTSGSIYECSFVVLDSTHISLIIKEHTTA